MPIQDCDGPIDVMLVYPVIPQGHQLNLPYGYEVPLSVTTVAAYLEQQGIKTEILDMNLHQEPYRLLRRFCAKLRPKVVGFTAITSHIYNAHKAATQVKEVDPQVVTVVGGIHVSAVPEDTLRRFPMFDYGVLGEGEVTFLNFVRHVLEASSPQKEHGLAYREDGQPVVNPPRGQIQDLDSLPFAAREKLEHSKYVGSPSNYLRLPTTSIATTRGCPYSCTFCSKSVYGRQSLRHMSPERAVAELEHCIETLHIRNFKAVDDTMTVKKKWVMAFCELLLKKGLNLSWNASSRVDAADLEMLKLMRRSGCFQIKWGP
ncbi:MAG TPA: cobalamin-dependent protein, partial [bacterium]|nr:cobalamin-dependent protein [bacterium]